MRVMVVDDDADIRKLLTVWLRGDGHEVIHAVDGYQAVHIARTQQPDVMFLDLMMPAGDGFSVHERLGNLANTAAMPVIYMSAEREAGDKALRAGGAKFLAKPLQKETVLKTLREVANGQH